MIVYDRSVKSARIYDYRETGPAALRNDSFNQYGVSRIKGGMVVGVPGEIRGIAAAHRRFGKLPWSDLLAPSIKIARNGFRMGTHMAGQFKKKSNQAAIRADPGLSEMFVNSDGSFKKLRDLIKNEKYAETLEKISADPEDFYKGELAASFVKDVRDNGGVITLDDIANYKVKERVPLKSTIKQKSRELNLFTTPMPGGGAVLVSILNINEGYKFDPSDISAKGSAVTDKDVLTYQRLVESFKFSYAKRPYLGDPDGVSDELKQKIEKFVTNMTSKAEGERLRNLINDSRTQPMSYYDPYFVKQNSEGTTHVSVIDKEGNAVSATETINWAFGAKIRSMTTGVIYNNEMSDFFTNYTYSGYGAPPANAPRAGKRPLSSTCPTVITDADGDVVMVAGASGGTRITLSTAWVIMKKLWFNWSLSDSVEDPRAMHTFSPFMVQQEPQKPLPDAMVDGLKAKGHGMKDGSSAIVQAIYVDKDKNIHAKSDSRKEGVAAGY